MQHNLIPVTPLCRTAPWLFAACSVWSGCHPSTSHKVWAGIQLAVGCTDAPGPSSASHRAADPASPAPRTVPGGEKRRYDSYSHVTATHGHKFNLVVLDASREQSSYPVCILQLIEVLIGFLPSLTFHLAKVLAEKREKKNSKWGKKALSWYSIWALLHWRYRLKLTRGHWQSAHIIVAGLLIDR